MSQLDNVLRRSIAHIDPADWQGRDRVFASAREAMIRLLRVYDPPLSSVDIDRKIKEFDDIIGAIEVEYRWARPLGDTLALAPPRRPAAAPALAALPPPQADEADEEDEGAAVDTGRVDEADELYADDADDEDYDDYEDYDGDEYDYDDEPRGGLFGLIDRIGWRVIAVAIGAILVVGLAGSAVLVMGHGSRKTTATSADPPAVIDAAAPASPAVPQASPTDEPVPAQTAAAQPQPGPAPAAPGGLALETLVLFDGRDPGVFQSTSDNPVVFQGDQDGGFARVSSSTTSAGARVRIGRGVYERIAGHRIRIVLVARASRTAPAMNVRFAYQNGRVQSPWSEVQLGSSYTPLSAEWTAPPERGGPENDSLIIEPGIPGDGTSIDVRSVRIEVLG